MGVPGRPLPLAIFGSPPRSELTLKLFSNNIYPKPFDMENQSVTEIAPMEVGMKKGFLESSEEFLSMIPFKEHASGLAAYEERS